MKYNVDGSREVRECMAEEYDADSVLQYQIDSSGKYRYTTTGQGPVLCTFLDTPMDVSSLILKTQYFIPTPASIFLSIISLTVQAELRKMKAPIKHLAISKL